jgi:hypothetical protein
MIPEGTAVPTKPRRDETLVSALVRGQRWRRRIQSEHTRSITEQESATDACHLPAAAAHLPGAGHCESDP